MIGVDVGGTKILGVVVDPHSGVIVERVQMPTPKTDPASVPTAIGDCVAELIARTEMPPAIGVGVPGLVDHDGVLHYGPNVQGVLGLDIAGVIRRRFGVPAFAANDANGAALAEHRFGAAMGLRHVVLVTQGTGIGGAIIVDGKVVVGANGFAGEPGHMVVQRGGPRCACGQLGCWEALASGAGLVNLALELVTEGRGRRLLEFAEGRPEHLRGEHVAAALAEGDPDAFEIIERFASWVAQGIGGLVNLLDPEAIIVGGGLTALHDHFLDEVRAQVPWFVMGSGHRPEVPILAARLGPEAGAIGSALLAADRHRLDGEDRQET